MNLLPGAVDPEQAVVVMHRTPWRQVVRQQTPGAAGAVEVQDSVDHLAHVHLAVSAAGLLGRDMRFDQPPLFVREITGVRIPFHPRIIPEIQASHTRS